MTPKEAEQAAIEKAFKIMDQLLDTFISLEGWLDAKAEREKAETTRIENGGRA